MPTQKDVADYYDTTQNHYEQWWNLSQHLSLHYGIWDDSTKSFGDSIGNTNKLMLKAAEITGTDAVLDAGCGVGGAAFYVNQETKARVTGLSLSPKQIALAEAMATEKGLQDQVQFKRMDFTKTTFPAAAFDVVWACESVCHVPDKRDFIREAYRLLKPGGRLVMCDFFLTDEHQEDKNQWISKWKNTWAVPDFEALKTFETNLKQTGFRAVSIRDYTPNIRKSARRMYYASLLGAVPSEIYNLLHPRVSKFARTHYKCGYYQYKALQENLWKYNLILAVK